MDIEITFTDIMPRVPIEPNNFIFSIAGLTVVVSKPRQTQKKNEGSGVELVNSRLAEFGIKNLANLCVLTALGDACPIRVVRP